MDKHHKEDLGMKALRSDPVIYIQMKDGLLKGLSGGFVDDVIREGDTSSSKLSKKTNEKFEMTDDQSSPCVFTGF